MSVQVPQPILDHAVINVADQLDSASARFRRLGFQLTERGHHSLGSSNHLAILVRTTWNCWAMRRAKGASAPISGNRRWD